MKKLSSKQQLQLHSPTVDQLVQGLSETLDLTDNLLPVTPQKIQEFSRVEKNTIEALWSLFSRAQDISGAKVFPSLLEVLGEQDETYIDKLNKLEKLNFLSSADWWANLREVRNAYTHSYPDNPEKIAENIEKLMESAYELISFWTVFKSKIQKYIK